MDQFPGPILAYGFITHNTNSQNGITFEESYLAYGFPEGGGGATPWLVGNLRFKRSNTASTTLTMSAAMEVPPTKMQAIMATAAVPPQAETSVGLMTAVAGSTNPEATLGILGMDPPRRQLGTRHQDAPVQGEVSGATHITRTRRRTPFDRQNVRDGHYTPWAPTPYIGRKDPATGKLVDPPVNGVAATTANAQRFYDLVMGNSFGTDDVNGLKVIPRRSASSRSAR